MQQAAPRWRAPAPRLLQSAKGVGAAAQRRRAPGNGFDGWTRILHRCCCLEALYSATMNALKQWGPGCHGLTYCGRRDVPWHRLEGRSQGDLLVQVLPGRGRIRGSHGMGFIAGSGRKLCRASIVRSRMAASNSSRVSCGGDATHAGGGGGTRASASSIPAT